MSMVGFRMTSVLLCLGAVSMFAGGCSIIGSSESVDVSGRPISEQTLASVTPGETSEQEMLDLLGAPSRTMVADDGGVIYVYEYRRTRSSSGHVLILFSGRTHKETSQATYVLVRDGIVVRCWSEGDAL